jgi:hypothetical protein
MGPDKRNVIYRRIKSKRLAGRSAHQAFWFRAIPVAPIVPPEQRSAYSGTARYTGYGVGSTLWLFDAETHATSVEYTGVGSVQRADVSCCPANTKLLEGYVQLSSRTGLSITDRLRHD